MRRACSAKRGATPAQTKVGIHLALGKTKPVIADELGLQLSSVADHSKKLYQNLDVHNSTELGTKLWLTKNYTRRAKICGAPDKFFRRRSHQRDLFETSRRYRSHAIAGKCADEKAAATRRWAGPRPKRPVAMTRLDLASG